MSKRFVDLFAGCGGLSLGMEKAGFEVAFASDIDPICSETYIKNRSLEKNKMFVGDIADLNNRFNEFSQNFKNIDLVCGGPPCQGFSMANRQRLINDPRNSLYKEYLVFLQKTKPKFFIMENVKGMLNKIDEILIDIKTYLGNEYDVAFDVFNAKNFGVPQNRERLIVIGNRIGIKAQTIINNIHEKEKEINKFSLGDAISDLPVLEPNRIKNNNKIECKETGFTCTEHSYIKTSFYTFINGNKKIKFLHNHKNRFNNDRDIEIFARLPQGGNSLHESIKDIMPYKSRNNIFKDKYYKLKADDICKTITSHMKFDCNMYIHPTQARGLSPREAARIQTFPDDFIFYGPQNSWYKQIGNAVPVKLAQIIGEEVMKYL
ncbi:MAG: DNA cytosine methyltransferase [Clostridiales bacterium]|nr:DNA cytosine methyltransferase [Clostridiales bacterium]